MKKLFTLFAFMTLFVFFASAQLPDGSTAPDWTLTDLNGVEHHLYDYLDNGYTVVIDFSATWCGPCWNYHTSGALEELYIQHGPAGMPNVSDSTTNDVMVFFIEGDASTTLADLQGTGSSTAGDWITGTPYPIIDDASMTAPYAIGFWPTIYTICSDGIINVTGQIPTEAHYEHAVACAIAALDYKVENTSVSSILGVDSNTEFTFSITNEGEGQEELRLTLSSNAPDDWSATLSANDNTDPVSFDIIIDGSADIAVTVDVTPGTSAALADYKVEIESLTNPGNIHIFMNYSVIAGITDLVLDNGGVATQWNDQFLNGLNVAENTAHGIIGTQKFIEGVNAGQLSEVKHLYYNIAWTFPSFTNESVGALATFLDNGGNLFVSGQDIGWDTWDSSSAANGTTQTRAFYTDYLRADYKADGSSGNSLLVWETNDFLFGNASVSAINDVYNGNIYPDEIDPIEPAVAIYHYNASVTKTGGVRVEESGHKIVYIGVDLAMMANETTRAQTIQLSHDWFHGLISATEFDEAFRQAVGQNYPNPTGSFTTIPFENLQEDIDLNVINALGQIILSEKIIKGTASYRLDLSGLSTGLYHCVLINEKGGKTVLPVVVTK